MEASTCSNVRNSKFTSIKNLLEENLTCSIQIYNINNNLKWRSSISPENLIT